METSEVKRDILYYKGIKIGKDYKRSYVYVNKVNESDVQIYTKKLADVSIGTGIEVTIVDNGVKGPYIPKFNDRHPNCGIWYAEDAANRAILQAKSANAKLPDDVEKFEMYLKRLTWDMTKQQKQAFLMKYILDIK